jgi:hypothetical protein
VDPVPDPLLLRESDSAGNRTRTSGSVARNSDHYTKETVALIYNYYKITSSYKICGMTVVLVSCCLQFVISVMRL